MNKRLHVVLSNDEFIKLGEKMDKEWEDFWVSSEWLDYWSSPK